MALNLKALLPLDHVVTYGVRETKQELAAHARPDGGTHTFCSLEKKTSKKEEANKQAAKRRLWIWAIY